MLSGACVLPVGLVAPSVCGRHPLRPSTPAARWGPPLRCAFINERFLEGMPSTPGWEAGRLNQLTEWAVSDQSNRPVICEYKADGAWLWRKWSGTVLSITVVPVLISMGFGVVIDHAARFGCHDTWPLLAVPPADEELIQSLNGLNTLWEYQLTLSTFILTFFTQQAYAYWRGVYFTTRAIQGRINDACMLVVMGAERGETCSVDGCEEAITGYSTEANAVVQRCTRLLRLSHTFFWAATPTCPQRANGLADGAQPGDVGAQRTTSDAPLRRAGRAEHDVVAGDVAAGDVAAGDVAAGDVHSRDAIGPLLLSPMGLERLVAAGEMTADEVARLLASGLPPSQYAYVLMEWAGMYATRAMQAGTLRGGAGYEKVLLEQFTRLRAEYFNIGDCTAGRMAMAYVQLVQVLIDSLVALAPLALYPQAGSLSIPLAGLLTLFFKGLLELSKSFLDPFGVEGYPGQNIRVDVLVSELNFGAGSRWVKAGATLPEAPTVDA